MGDTFANRTNGGTPSIILPDQVTDDGTIDTLTLSLVFPTIIAAITVGCIVYLFCKNKGRISEWCHSVNASPGQPPDPNGDDRPAVAEPRSPPRRINRSAAIQNDRRPARLDSAAWSANAEEEVFIFTAPATEQAASEENTNEAA